MFQNIFDTPHYRFPADNISQPGQVGIITNTRSSREKDANRGDHDSGQHRFLIAAKLTHGRRPTAASAHTFNP